jgi:outer membrane protein OmpA-like peptidoglycan-associated protein
MRSLSSSLGLVMFLALSNLTYGQFNSKEYLLSIGDLVNKKVLSEPYSINPLQKLYYVHLLPPNYLWKDLATMISLRAATENESAWSFVDDLSNIMDKIRWSDAELIKEPVNEPVREFVTVPRNESVRKEPSEYISPVVVKEPAEAVKPLEKKTAAPANKNSKNTSATASVVEIEEESELLPAHLEGIISDDYIEYGSIGFYANAAVIHPSYKAEINSLASHMKDDPTLELIIHGHCNGNAPRTIITPGILTRFFEIDTFHQKQTASAKELTDLRAEYAKRYLVSQGIAQERIQTIGEGGEMMIYPPTSDHAHYNDRVEFELITPNKNPVEVGLITPGVD